MVHRPWPRAHGKETGLGPGQPPHTPWALSHEPRTTNHRKSINEYTASLLGQKPKTRTYNNITMKTTPTNIKSEASQVHQS